jgi:hypothetical protein
MKHALRFLIILALFGFIAPPSTSATTTLLTPPVGSWSWCTDTLVNGCIEAVTITSPENVETTVTSAETIPAGLTIGATCSANDSIQNCDSKRYEAKQDGSCGTVDGFNKRNVPSVEMDIFWPGKTGWKIAVRFSTGNFQPVFTIGSGTVSTLTTNDGDGTFTYTQTSVIDKLYSGSGPGPFAKDSVAISMREGSHVQVWPLDHLNQLTGPGPKQTGCNFYPFIGSWAEANAQSFSWSYIDPKPSSPLIGQAGTIPNKLFFKASAPHFAPQNASTPLHMRNPSDPLEVIPARVQVFLPTEYFATLGYQSLDEFDASSYAVDTEDGQPTSPTTTKREDGILINLGVKHYSAPNPSVTFAVKSTNKYVAPILKLTPNKPIATPVVTVPQTVSPKVMTLKRKTTKTATAFIKYKGAGAKTWRASGACKMRGTKVQAGTKAGTCKLKLTVKNSRKKIIATRSVTIKIR